MTTADYSDGQVKAIIYVHMYFILTYFPYNLKFKSSTNKSNLLDF